MPRGVSRKAELAPKARKLREQGLKYREIEGRLGVPMSTVSSWLTDPDLSKQRVNRKRYAGTCSECGGPTDGSRGPGRAPDICNRCRKAGEREQSRERLIAAIQTWADEHGGCPPTATEWDGAGWPFTSTVIRVFGSWNAAIATAGFKPKPVGHHGRDGEDPEVCSEMLERYRDGESIKSLAREYDCARNTASYRIRKAQEMAAL